MASLGSKRYLIVALVLVILIVAILLAVFIRPRPSSSPPSGTDATTSTTPPSPGAVATTPALQTPPVPSGQVAVQSLARLFTERYGSYSTEANYANLTDVLPLMTDALAAKTRTAVQMAKTPAAFYGVTTRAVAVKIGAFNDAAGTASATVSTQRQETTGTAAPTVKYQDLALTFQKVGDDWKVASATWR